MAVVLILEPERKTNGKNLSTSNTPKQARLQNGTKNLQVMNPEPQMSGYFSALAFAHTSYAFSTVESLVAGYAAHTDSSLIVIDDDLFPNDPKRDDGKQVLVADFLRDLRHKGDVAALLAYDSMKYCSAKPVDDDSPSTPRELFTRYDGFNFRAYFAKQAGAGSLLSLLDELQISRNRRAHLSSSDIQRGVASEYDPANSTR